MGPIEQIEHGGELRVERKGLGQTEGIAHDDQVFVATAMLDTIHFAKLGPVHDTPRVHHLWVIAAVLVTGPPAPELQVEASGDAIGIVWHEQATVTPAIQQRLAQSWSREGAPAVVVDARARARARIAMELDLARAQEIVRYDSMLADAIAAYRAGEIDDARARLKVLLEAIAADPVVPGAVRVAWRAHVLRGQLAFTEGDLDEQDAALDAAVALDPEARPSTRELPPAVVEAYSRRQAEVISGAASWPELKIEVESGTSFVVEIDGIVGRRPVPPGEHLVVVRRPGISPVGMALRTGVPWSVPAVAEALVSDLPRTREDAQEICDRLELDWLGLARVRTGRLGLQRYECGEGFSAAWFEDRKGWGPGLTNVEAPPEAGFTYEPVLHLDRPWPALSREPKPRPQVASDSGSGLSSARARWRRAWPWVLISGVIAGGVTAGVVLGGDPEPDLAIDGNGFLGR